MNGSRRPDLRIVYTDDIRPHEIADPVRERRIEARLRSDRLLRDPLLVGAVPDIPGFVLLDGTNRKRALAAMRLPRAMVQVIDYADQHAVQLRTWCHAARVPLDNLLESARNIQGVSMSALPPLEAIDALASSSTLAVLLTRKERYALIRVPNAGASRTTQLRQLVDLYEEHMSRVDCDPEEVEERAHAMTAPDSEESTLVAFPRFSRSQVVAMATQDQLIPAGITRHVILGGRALRVNLPLKILDGSGELDETNVMLQQHLHALQPRFYSEPTILFDS